MKPTGLHILSILITCFIVTTSCSQKNTSTQSPPVDYYVGSTPCDSLIKSMLGISSSVKCDFIKWNMHLQKNGADTFHLAARYGESIPNTNELMNGGTIELSGKYTITHGVNKNLNTKVYSLQPDQVRTSFLLIEMDSNILHFADTNGNFIVGNGGWGYVLNRAQQ